MCLTWGMAIETAEIERASSLVRDLAGRDVSCLSAGDLLTAHEAVARLGRLTGALQSRFAGEIARRSTPDLPGGGLARQQGFGSAGAMVASVTGGSQAGAWRSIEAGRALMSEVAPGVQPLESLQSSGAAAPRYPAVARAALEGELSVDAAGLITAGLETLTDRVSSGQLHALEERLVGKAVGLGASEVRRLVANAVARADVAGLQERESRQYEQRFVTWTEDHSGMVTFAGRFDVVSAAPLRTVIEQMVTQQFRNRRDQDPLERDHRTVGQMRADALFEICRHALGCAETDRSGVRTTMVVRMDERDLRAGIGVGSIDGTVLPVSVGELRRVAGDAGIVPAVLGGTSEVLDLGRKVRIFTRAQRLALLERDGGCAKCHAPPEHCEAHHIRWWEQGGPTDMGNGVMLCTRCHHDVHRHGWQIRAKAGRVEFIPPPNIDPTQIPRLGGLAAITISISDLGDAGGSVDLRENSASEQAARENSASDLAGPYREVLQNSAPDEPASRNAA